MRLVRCSAGHFYDEEKFVTCPHCGGGGGMLGDRDSQATIGLRDTPDLAVGGNERDGSETMPLPSPQWGDERQGRQTPSPFDLPPISGMAGGKMDPGDDDKTVGMSPRPVTNGQGKDKSGIDREPVVGWLVCTKGKNIGMDFRLKTGRNFVGRDKAMDICLRGEETVSRNRHVIVVYEPKRRIYLIQPGESKELAYLNDELVLSPIEMKAYDVVAIGDVRLMFLPLCGESFNWEDVAEEEWGS